MQTNVLSKRLIFFGGQRYFGGRLKLWDIVFVVQ